MNIKTLTLFTIILSSISCAQKMSFDFGDRSTDEVLLSHLHHLTRYQHTFNEDDKGTCGVLFDLAVEQYNKHLQGKNILVLTDKLLEEGNSFDQGECQHVSEGFTWINLQVTNEQTRCSVHVPLNLLNYERGDSEEHPLLNLHYAIEAIMEKDSICVDIESGHEVIMYPSIEPVTLEQEPIVIQMDTVYNPIEHKENNKEQINNVVSISIPADHPKTNLSNQEQKDEPAYIQLPTIDAYYQEHPIMTQEQTVEFNFDQNKISSSRVNDFDESELDKSVEFTNFLNKQNTNKEKKKSSNNNEFLSTHEELLGGPRNCSQEEVGRVLELYAAMVTMEKMPGLVLYSENIVECTTQHERDQHYEAIIATNDEKCFFGVIAYQEDGEMEYVGENQSNLPRCEEMEI